MSRMNYGRRKAVSRVLSERKQDKQSAAMRMILSKSKHKHSSSKRFLSYQEVINRLKARDRSGEDQS